MPHAIAAVKEVRRYVSPFLVEYVKVKGKKERVPVETNKWFEIWEGLPNLPFKEALSTGNLHSLLYEEDKDYIWVPADARAAHELRPYNGMAFDTSNLQLRVRDSTKPLYYVFCRAPAGEKQERREHGPVDAWWMEPLAPPASPIRKG